LGLPVTEEYMTTKEQLRRVGRSLSPIERARLKFQYEREESQPPQDLLTGMSKSQQTEYRRALFMLGRIHIICELTLMGIEAQLREASLFLALHQHTQMLVRFIERLRDLPSFWAEKRVAPEYKQLLAEYNHFLEEAQQEQDIASSKFKLEYCWSSLAGLEGFIARIRDEEFDGQDILAPTICDRLKRATQVASELGREHGLEMDIRIPVVARLAGTNLDEGDRILRDSGLPVVRAADLGEAARKAVEAAGATA